MNAQRAHITNSCYYKKFVPIVLETPLFEQFSLSHLPGVGAGVGDGDEPQVGNAILAAPVTA